MEFLKQIRFSKKLLESFFIKFLKSFRKILKPFRKFLIAFRKWNAEG